MKRNDICEGESNLSIDLLKFYDQYDIKIITSYLSSTPATNGTFYQNATRTNDSPASALITAV